MKLPSFIQPIFIKKKPVFDVAAQNRKDIRAQLATCFTIEETRKILTVFGWCISDFTPEDQFRFVKAVHDREALISYCEANFAPCVYTANEIDAMFQTLNKTGRAAFYLMLQRDIKLYPPGTQIFAAEIFEYYSQNPEA